MWNLARRISCKACRLLEARELFSSDPLADLGFLREGMQDRSRTMSDEKIIARIIDSYHKAKKDQLNAGQPYLPGGAWKDDIEERRASYLAALSTNDSVALTDLLRNFFRNNGVAGLWIYAYYQDLSSANDQKKKRFIIEMLKDYHTCHGVIDAFKTAKLAIPSVGNPWGNMIDGTVVLPTAPSHYHYASQIHNVLQDVQRPVVCEIGGGFGGFAYFLSNLTPGIKYIGFDLPEIQVVAQYFLMNAFPAKSVLLYGEEAETKISDDLLNRYDIVLMPNYVIPALADNLVDCFVNTRSLSEMDYHTIKEYIGHIVRVTRRYFFHDNSNQPSLNTGGHIEVPSSRFPIPKDRFRRIYTSTSPWGGGGGRYREYLFERIGD